MYKELMYFGAMMIAGCIVLVCANCVVENITDVIAFQYKLNALKGAFDMKDIKEIIHIIKG